MLTLTQKLATVLTPCQCHYKIKHIVKCVSFIIRLNPRTRHHMSGNSTATDLILELTFCYKLEARIIYKKPNQNTFQNTEQWSESKIMLEISVSQWLSIKFRDRRATSGVGTVSHAGSKAIDKGTVKPHPMLKRCKTACIFPQEPSQKQLHSSGYTISKAGLDFICYAARRTWNHDQHHSAALSFRDQAITTSCGPIHLVRKMWNPFSVQ